MIGAGMAGLSAATMLAERGVPVTLHEAAPQAGGRCRSYDDAALGLRIDNGNHLVLSGNHGVRAYLARIGAEGTVRMPPAEYPFRDLRTGRAWALKIGAGRVPWWLLASDRRVPDTGVLDYLSLFRLRSATGRTVAETLGDTGMLYHRFWSPFVRAVLNTEPESADAGLLWPVVEETLLRGGDACRPLMPTDGLGGSFVDPALDYLRAHGAELRIGSRVRGLALQGGRVAALARDQERIALGDGDAVVLAVPPGVAADMLPGLDVPTDFRAILNGHFRLPAASDTAAVTGFVDGLSEWLFVRGELASVTVSAADPVIDRDAVHLAADIWGEIAPVLGLSAAPLPPYRIVKEKRATFAQTPAQTARRPGPGASGLKNLALAGDWTDTGLPATIEGAIRSGTAAAGLVLDQMRKF